MTAEDQLQVAFENFLGSYRKEIVHRLLDMLLEGGHITSESYRTLVAQYAGEERLSEADFSALKEMN